MRVAADSAASPPARYGIEYDSHTRIEEKEQTSFDAEGVIRNSGVYLTENGSLQQIDLMV